MTAVRESPSERAPAAAVAPAGRRRRTVAGRLLGSYLLVLLAFAVTVGWSFQALRAAASDAELLRGGYAPLLLDIGEAQRDQNVFLTQLNHITPARNPIDVREWLEAARLNRPAKFADVRKDAEQHLESDTDPGVSRLRDWIAAASPPRSKQSLESDQERFAKLYPGSDREGAQRAQSDLVKREAEGAARLKGMRGRVEEAMESLTAAARHREERSIELLVGLALLTLLVGVMTSLYARRVLAPLTTVTARANAVARGDLTPHPVVDTNDEIGELATTFEGMVAAIQRARSELVQAERLATIGKMAAHVTHEIRNPLSAIGLNVELLEEEVAATGEKEPMALVQAIKSEVDRLSRIAEQYLSVARRPRPHLERERVDDLVRELCAFVRPELDRAGVTLIVETAPDLREVELDESQLRQALLNLIRNAREAMPRGGDLTVEVVRVSGGEAEHIEVRVDDTGAGVPEELRASIFDPFFTTKQRGTGLGLAVTREIVEAHGGTIHCEPRPDRGTRFRIDLPVAGERPREPSGRASALDEHHQPRHHHEADQQEAEQHEQQRHRPLRGGGNLSRRARGRADRRGPAGGLVGARPVHLRPSFRVLRAAGLLGRLGGRLVVGTRQRRRAAASTARSPGCVSAEPPPGAAVATAKLGPRAAGNIRPGAPPGCPPADRRYEAWRRWARPVEPCARRGGRASARPSPAECRPVRRRPGAMPRCWSWVTGMVPEPVLLIDAVAESTRGASGGVACADRPFLRCGIGIAMVAAVSSVVISTRSLFTCGRGPELSKIAGVAGVRGIEDAVDELAPRGGG